MTETEFRIVAALLFRGKQAERLSDGICLIACLGLLLAVPALRGILVATVILGIISKYYAIRVALDAHLFELMAQETDRLTDSTASLDHLLMPKSASSRSWTDRAKGARHLMMRQLVLLVLQLLVFVGGIVIVQW